MTTTTMTIETAKLASAIISIFEGPGPRNNAGLYMPYQDGGGVWTIGRGHTAGVTAATPPATQFQVDDWFAADQVALFKLVASLPVLEAAAWLSFGFNCGMGAMLACMRAGAEHLRNYVHDAKGNVEPGLVTRRDREYFLILLSRRLS